MGLPFYQTMVDINKYKVVYPTRGQEIEVSLYVATMFEYIVCGYLDGRKLNGHVEVISPFQP